MIPRPKLLHDFISFSLNIYRGKEKLIAWGSDPMAKE